MGMVRRRTRRRTMMVAGGLAYERGRNQGQQDANASERASAEPTPAAAPPPPAPSADNATGELERLASMHASGALSDDEFAAAKQQVLGAERAAI